MKPPELEVRTCCLVLKIRIGKTQAAYHVKPIDSELHVRAYEVEKSDGMVYHCTQADSGKIECDCGAATFHDRRCKHASALYRLGLFLRPREVLGLEQYGRR